LSSERNSQHSRCASTTSDWGHGLSAKTAHLAQVLVPPVATASGCATNCVTQHIPCLLHISHLPRAYPTLVNSSPASGQQNACRLTTCTAGGCLCVAPSHPAAGVQYSQKQHHVRNPMCHSLAVWGTLSVVCNGFNHCTIHLDTASQTRSRASPHGVATSHVEPAQAALRQHRPVATSSICHSRRSTLIQISIDGISTLNFIGKSAS
jgi:hypothetical protein